MPASRRRFREHGAIFWPDNACRTLKPDVWQIFGMDWMVPGARKEIAFESVQYLIAKTRCARELRMALWYAERSDFVFRVVYGDKECFHLARSSFSIAARTSGGWVATAGTTHSPTRTTASTSWLDRERMPIEFIPLKS